MKGLWSSDVNFAKSVGTTSQVMECEARAITVVLAICLANAAVCAFIPHEYLVSSSVSGNRCVAATDSDVILGGLLTGFSTQCKCGVKVHLSR